MSQHENGLEKKTGRDGMVLAVVAMGVYIIGGLSTFSGLGLIWLMKGKDLFGLGDGRSIGYLLLCVGLALNILGVLLMRIFRNRDLA
ncbi:MAG: hypothetical protein C0621_09055 [Desulfuromonas sp.]|nr:MAG: hypothetical protein C0621_09055 [Desulfuromonas sp.]